MGVNWGGIGDAFANLGGMVNKIKDPSGLEALKNKAYGIGQMIEPNLLALSPEAQMDIMKPIIQSLAGLKQNTNPFEAFGMGFGNSIMGGGGQPQDPMAPRNVAPPQARVDIPTLGGVGAPKFKIGDKVRMKDGTVATIEDESDIATATKLGAVIYR